jgi:hypothetical protein
MLMLLLLLPLLLMVQAALSAQIWFLKCRQS